MNKAKRLNFTMDNFPFKDLCIAQRNELSLSTFDTIHQTTKVRTANGQSEEYSITFPEGMKSDAISYYIDAAQRNLMNPTLYLHPTVYPLWTTLDSEGNNTRDEDGMKVEEFFKQWTLAFYREWIKLSEDDRQWIAGDRQGLASATDLLEPMVQHPKFPKTHPKSGKRDTEKPPTLAMAIWSGDVTKRKQENDKKKKFAYLKKNADENEVKPSTDFMIPDTNEIIYCDIRDVSRQNIKRVGKEKASERIHDYGKIKHMTYNKDGHPNASDTNCELLNDLTILGPSLLWTPSKNQPGVAKLKVSKLTNTYWKPMSHSAGMSADQLNTIEEKAAKKKALFGLADEDSEDDSSDGDEKTEQPVFTSEFEKRNWEEQQECRKQLKVLGERRAQLNKQKAEPTLNELKRKAIKKELSIIDTRYKKKLSEQMELEEMRNPVNSGDASMDGSEEEGCRDDDSAASH